MWLDAETAQFRIFCLGRRPLFVNGDATLPGTWRSAPNGSLIEIGDVPLLLRVNTIMTNRARKAVTPVVTPTNSEAATPRDDGVVVDDD